jgi:predicted phage tail protein
MNDNMEGGTREKCNEENDNCSSLRITSQAKANIEPNDNQNNDIKNINKEGNTKHDNEEGHSNDKFKAIEDDSRRNKVETTLTQLLKNNDKLLNAQDKLLEDKNKLLENQKKNKLIESQEVVIEKQNQLLKEMEKLLEKNSTGADGIEEVVVRKITSRRQKAKHVDNAEDASEVNKIEFLEEKIKLLEANLKNVLDKTTKDETQKDKPPEIYLGDVQLTEGNTKCETLSEVFAGISVNATSTGRTASEDLEPLPTVGIAKVRGATRLSES